MDIVLELFANCQVKIHTATEVPSRPGFDGSREKSRHRLAKQQQEVERLRWDLYLLSLHGQKKLLPAIKDHANEYSPRELVLQSTALFYDESINTVVRLREDAIAPYLPSAESVLDILKKSQARPRRHSTWGLAQRDKKFTSRARRHILEAGNEMEAKYGCDSVTMLTLTIPGSGAAVYDCVSRWSGWLVNRLLQRLRDYSRRLLAKEGIGAPDWFFVWEFQKRGALHLHFAIGHDDRDVRWEAARRLKRGWYDGLDALGQNEGIDLYRNYHRGFSHRENQKAWQSDIQDCKKNVAGYFAKYCSKSGNSKDVGALRASSKTLKSCSLSPSRWWGSCKALKASIKSYRVRIRIRGLDYEQTECWKARIARFVERVTGQRIDYAEYAVKPSPDFTVVSGSIGGCFFSSSQREVIREAFRSYAGIIKSCIKDY